MMPVPGHRGGLRNLPLIPAGHYAIGQRVWQQTARTIGEHRVSWNELHQLQPLQNQPQHPPAAAAAATVPTPLDTWICFVVEINVRPLLPSFRRDHAIPICDLGGQNLI